MGLDIYLYRYDDFKKTQELEETYSKLTKNIWEGNDENEKYNLLSEEQKQEYRNKELEIANSLGLNRWGSHEDGKTHIELNSKSYPEHMFKIGYFRSSYNDGGIERILRNLNLPTIAKVFDHEHDEYIFQPNWEKSLTRIIDLINKFKECKPYRVHSVSSNMFNKPMVKNEKDALNIFLDEIKKDQESSEKYPEREKYNYSNINGEFSFNEPLKVLALIPGTQNILGERECVYYITESDNTWYLEALEIVKETILWVLSQENKEQYYLHWSG